MWVISDENRIGRSVFNTEFVIWRNKHAFGVETREEHKQTKKSRWLKRVSGMSEAVSRYRGGSESMWAEAAEEMLRRQLALCTNPHVTALSTIYTHWSIPEHDDATRLLRAFAFFPRAIYVFSGSTFGSLRYERLIEVLHRFISFIQCTWSDILLH